MAKFLKSIFTPEKKRSSRIEGEGDGEKDDFTPPLDGRRKLSISRSGRMKANKRRHELDMDLYGDNNQCERPKNVEYHVNKTVEADPSRRRSSLDNRKEKKSEEERRNYENATREIEQVRTPEEEIESAFEIIDKIS